ncbi:MAG: right-handed parallel beta-helix repeat-containing protein [Pyrinomonadaceae bacterium]
MKELLMSQSSRYPLLIALVILSSFGFRSIAQVRQPQTSSRTVFADRFPGADLGARINAADRSLGAAAGEIVVRGGGKISTQVIVSKGHTLRFMRGIYAPDTTGIPILLKSGSSLVGESWDAIILESPAANQFTVIKAYNNLHNQAADSDITVRDIQIKGANPGFDSAQQAVSLGNCSRCIVNNVWVNGTRSIGIQLGGASEEGNFAQDSKVTNCLFTRVASQNLALVNGRNIVFEGNRFLAPSQAGGPGSTAIDLEPNSASDRLQNVIVRNNMIDARNAELPTAGNGILAQAGSGTTLVGPIIIENNTIIGGSIQPPVTKKISNALYLLGPMKDVTIRNNRVTRTGQAGIHIEGTRLIVTGNQFTDVGGGGIAGFRIQNVTDSQIVGNTFTYTGQGSADATMELLGANRNNVIRNNTGFGAPQAR